MDERLRRNQREAASGDSDAKTRLLTDRLRSGEVTKKRLEVAAKLGSKESAVAIGKEADSLASLDEDSVAWVRNLAQFKNRELNVRLVRAATDHWLREQVPDGVVPPYIQQALDFVDRWIVSGNDERLKLVKDVLPKFWPNHRDGVVRGLLQTINHLDESWDYGAATANDAIRKMSHFTLAGVPTRPMADAEGNPIDAWAEISRRIRAALPAVIDWLEGGSDKIKEAVVARENREQAQAAQNQLAKEAEQGRRTINKQRPDNP